MLIKRVRHLTDQAFVLIVTITRTAAIEKLIDEFSSVATFAFRQASLRLPLTVTLL